MLATLVALPHGWLHAAEGTGVAFFAGLALASVALYGAGARMGRAVARLGEWGAPAARWGAAAVCAGACGWLLAPILG